MGSLIKRMTPGDYATVTAPDGLFTRISMTGLSDDLPPSVRVRSSLDDRELEIAEGEVFKTHLRGSPVEVKFVGIERNQGSSVPKAKVVFSADRSIGFDMRRSDGKRL